MISDKGDIAETIACHLAGHKLFVAGSATLKLTTTILATAARAAAHVAVFKSEEVDTGLHDLDVDSMNAVTAQGGSKNVDDVFHY